MIFTLVALISAIGGCVGLDFLIRTNSQYATAMEYYGVAQGDVGRLDAEFNSSRAVLRDVVLYTDVQKIQETETKLNASDAKIDQYLGKLKNECLPIR